MSKSPLNEKILDADKVRVIRLQAEIVRDQNFFLAGGTGLGLRLGHRRSQDLDWFTPQDFEICQLEDQLGRLSEKPVKVEQHGAHTLRAYYRAGSEPLETSFIMYRQVRANPESLQIAGTEIPIADIEVMAAMKAAAVHDRGSKRDFIDIHAICGLPGWSVGRFIEHATKKLPLQPEQMRLALTYFADAEKEPMPAGYSVSWEKVKNDLTNAIRKWERDRDRSMER